MSLNILKKYHLELSTNRIMALTDGVFAIAMTLLVLNFDISLPDKSIYIAIEDKLKDQLPEFLHYVESFVILASFWVRNHQQFHFFKKTDQKFLWINMIGLMMICLIPYSTSIVSDYGEHTIAALFFELNMFTIGIIYYLIWTYATSEHKLVDSDLTPDVIGFHKKGDLVIPFLSVIAILISLLHPRWGTTTYFLIPVISVLRSHNYKKSS